MKNLPKTLATKYKLKNIKILIRKQIKLINFPNGKWNLQNDEKYPFYPSRINIILSFVISNIFLYYFGILYNNKLESMFKHEMALIFHLYQNAKLVISKNRSRSIQEIALILLFIQFLVININHVNS